MSKATELKGEDREPSVTFVPRTIDVDEMLVIEALASGTPVTKELLDEWHAFVQLKVAKLWRARAEEFLMAFREAHRPERPTSEWLYTEEPKPPEARKQPKS